MTDTDPPLEAGANLRAWREAEGLSLRELAHQLVDEDGTPLRSYASLSRYESGAEDPPLKILRALGRRYGVPPGLLLLVAPRDGTKAPAEALAERPAGKKAG